MTTPNTDPEASQADDLTPPEGITPDGDPEGTERDTDVFPRKVVEDLRREAQGLRERAKSAEARSDELARELFAHKVAALGKLADPADLEYSEELLSDPEALNAAVDDLLTKRPHYAARRVTGTVGQGHRGDSVAAAPTFADLLRS